MNSLEDELSKTLVQEIQKEIDDSIMLDFLVACGWTKVPYHFTGSHHAVDVTDWLTNTLGDKWKRLAGSFIFEDSKHAEWFILKWL